MKLEAGRPVDDADLRMLWPLTTFSGIEDAFELFHEAYPMSQSYDEHLEAWLGKLIERVESGRRPAGPRSTHGAARVD